MPGVGHLKFYYCPDAGYLPTRRTTSECLAAMRVGFGDSNATENPNKMLFSYLFHLWLITYGSKEIKVPLTNPCVSTGV